VCGIENEQFMCYLISLFGAFQAIPYGSFTGVRVLNEALDYWRANKEPIPRAVLSNWLTNLPLCDDYPPYFDRFPRNEQQDPDEAMLYLISASIPFETMSNALKFTIFEYRSLVCGHSTRPQQIDEVVVKMGIPDRLPFVSFQELLYNFENSVGDIMECETCGKKCVYTSHIQFSELKDYLFVKFNRERAYYVRNNTKIMGISEGISILCNNILMKYDPVAVIDHIPALGRENFCDRGHFVCQVLDPETDFWYTKNDKSSYRSRLFFVENQVSFVLLKRTSSVVSVKDVFEVVPDQLKSFMMATVSD
jgi:hypothetical protein